VLKYNCTILPVKQQGFQGKNYIFQILQPHRLLVLINNHQPTSTHILLCQCTHCASVWMMWRCVRCHGPCQCPSAGGAAGPCRRRAAAMPAPPATTHTVILAWRRGRGIWNTQYDTWQMIHIVFAECVSEIMEQKRLQQKVINTENFHDTESP